MSMDPNMMMQMLAGGLGGQPQQQGPVASAQQPLGAAAQLAQKIMLMQALQQRPQQPPPQQPPPYPQPNVMGGVAAQPQAMQMMQRPGGVNA